MLMGSEGRGEQTVRTDQDNGHLLASEVPEADSYRLPRSLFRGTGQLWVPALPGNVMVRNPVWSQPVDSFVTNSNPGCWRAIPMP